MAQTKKPVRLYVLLTILWISVLLFMLFRPFPKPEQVKAERTNEEIIRDFSTLYWKTRLANEGTTWLGTTVQQVPSDMWVMQEIIVRQKPDFVIETGTLKGGSALFFATLFHAFKDSGRVITVNIKKETDPATEEMPVFKEHVIQIIGDASSEETVRKIEAIVQGKSALVMIDDYHEWRHVLKELPLYARFVKTGGYMVLHDTKNDTYARKLAHRYEGPLKAARKFIEDGAPFEFDRTMEKFLLTYCPMGFLKRVRD